MLVAIAAILMVAAGGIAANRGQDQIAARALMSPQARDPADEVSFVFQGGIAHGQTLRFNVVPLATVNPGPPQMELTVFDSQGGILVHVLLFGQNQNIPGLSGRFDLNADQLPQEKFDNTGRIEIAGMLKTVNPGPPQTVNHGPPMCGFVASAEVLDNGTGKTTIHIPGEQLSGCANGNR